MFHHSRHDMRCFPEVFTAGITTCSFFRCFVFESTKKCGDLFALKKIRAAFFLMSAPMLKTDNYIALDERNEATKRKIRFVARQDRKPAHAHAFDGIDALLAPPALHTTQPLSILELFSETQITQHNRSPSEIHYSTLA